jgi:hypothetical protein
VIPSIEDVLSLAERHGGSKYSVQSQLDDWLPVGGARSPEFSRRVLDC